MQRPNDTWKACPTREFWGDLARHDHMIQVYESEKEFIALLSSYIFHGLLSAEPVVVIATPRHITQLKARMEGREAGASSSPLVTFLDAGKTLEVFMVNGWPNARQFNKFMDDLIARVAPSGEHVRIFGEMVAILLDKNSYTASLQLGKLYVQVMSRHSVNVFCAYPRSSFRKNPKASMLHICRHHTRILAPDGHTAEEVLYKNAQSRKHVLSKTKHHENSTAGR